MKRFWMVVCLLLTQHVAPVGADESLAGKACRSVHLQYQAQEGEWFHNSIVVEKSAPGTYFCTGGFSQGYLGIQQLDSGKHLAIFSVWDPSSGDDPKKVDPEKRVRLLAKGPDTRIGRFGGEGTGGQSFIDNLNWKPGQEVRFLLHAKAMTAEKRTAYTAWVRLPDGPWQLMATFSTLSDGRLLKGTYAFIEDFKRNGASAKIERRSYFKNAQTRNTSGEWVPVTKARFTADSNPSLSIDSGTKDNAFFLATGGPVTNTHVKLRETMSIEAKAVPVELPEVPEPKPLKQG